MKEVTADNFGVVIAFWLPGFALLWGLSYSFDEINVWFNASNKDGQTVGAFLFATFAALALGMFLSALRWLVVDHLMALIGVKRPPMDFSKLKDDGVRKGFDAIVQNHYRYYQYYSNTLVAVMCAFASFVHLKPGNVTSTLACLFGLVSVALFLASRNSLQLYYQRSAEVFS